MDLTRLEPQTGAAFVLRTGQRLTVVDPTGGQVSDFYCVLADDHDEWLSAASGYLQRIAADRVGGVQAGWGA